MEAVNGHFMSGSGRWRMQEARFTTGFNVGEPSFLSCLGMQFSVAVFRGADSASESQPDSIGIENEDAVIARGPVAFSFPTFLPSDSARKLLTAVGGRALCEASADQAPSISCQ